MKLHVRISLWVVGWPGPIPTRRDGSSDASDSGTGGRQRLLHLSRPNGAPSAEHYLPDGLGSFGGVSRFGATCAISATGSLGGSR
jgi:hypothetical protein